MTDRDLYDAYVKGCEERGLEPLEFERWRGPQRLDMDILRTGKRGESMTKEDAAKVLGYKNSAPVSRAIACGHLERDGSGGVTDESVMRYAKRRKERKIVSAAGINDRRFADLDDDDKIVISKKALTELVRIKMEEARRDVLSRTYSVEELAEAI